MDTREKIRSLDEFIACDASPDWIIVLGVFDPFTVEVARYLTGLAVAGKRLLVIVSEPAKEGLGGEKAPTLLSADARAKMLASLRVVDAVVIAPESAAKGAFRRAKIDLRIEQDPAADRRRSEQFVRYVLDRQASAAGQKN